MSASVTLPARPGVAPALARPSRAPEEKGRWWRFALLILLTALTLIPIAVVIGLSLQPSAASTTTDPITLENFATVLTETSVLVWLRNSLVVTLATVLVSVLVAAPAGYVLSRGRGRVVSGYSLLLFVIQSLPVIVSVVPLFILFAGFGLSDSLFGITLVYVGSTIAVATWMMAAYIDSIPIALEEAAWIDGASVFGGFVRIILRNSLPGILSTAIFAFLLAWNDYLVALVFLRSELSFTLPVGVQSFVQQNMTDWGSIMAVSVIMMIPPILLFATLNRYFSVGGIGGSLAGR
ncbi:carbohydrate ABC transporter permease [Mycetocola saprophilus]|uniref:carbohydrate ABC transporter permease n=1 Tax=Mycetocola saprophilus TaxID=76636 RepID=UPI0004BF4FEC|nr:carbohydrate ABC transporter permease [Mycetocola saprophilus]